jgi:hypothetical protein
VGPEIDVSVAETVVRIRVRGTPWGMDADLRPILEVKMASEPPPDVAVYDEIHTYEVHVTYGIDVIGADDSDETATAGASGEAFWPVVRRGSAIEIDDLPDTVVGVLDQIQDEIAETLTEPWPATRSRMPEPFAKVRDGRFVAGYGDPSNPVLSLVSVPVDDLR